jgi:triacylglycerol lipase
MLVENAHKILPVFPPSCPSLPSINSPLVGALTVHSIAPAMRIAQLGRPVSLRPESAQLGRSPPGLVLRAPGVEWDGPMLHRLYFSPGMFGFGRLASYDYFVHLERALTERLHAHGDDVETHVLQVSPTASIRRRASKLAELVASTCGPDGPSGGPIHLIGHSTGGLDARLVASPSASLAAPPGALSWRHRLASITTMNTPHFGTPLASFFTTVSGERVLRALTALTFLGLSLGSPPLAAVSALVAAFARVDRALGLELAVLDRTTDAFLRMLDDARSSEVRDYIDAIQKDQGAMVQLMPEAMDLFAAGIEERPSILRQSIASIAPAPRARMLLPALLRPWDGLSAALFSILYRISARYDHRYPCSAPDTSEEDERLLARTFGRTPGLRENDGVVPLRSQLWGKLVWVGYGDHLDVLGHFRDTERRSWRTAGRGIQGDGPPHVDWLYSASAFDRARFATLVDAMTPGLVSSAHSITIAA